MLMGRNAESKTYAAFALSWRDPVSDRYLDQLKIVPHFALTTIFKVDKERHVPERQSLTLEEAMIGFVAAQGDKWNDQWSLQLKTERNGRRRWRLGRRIPCYWGAYRIRSRPWLVTK